MTKKRRTFKTEVQKLLDLVIHSLYTKKEIFLRELLSNASDAIDRLRYESLTDKGLIKKGYTGRIKIIPDKAARTLTISDNGIGMDQDEVNSNLGTIASSGTKKFLESLQEAKGSAIDNSEFIGQFGVGFYSAFMIADHVTVITKRAGGKDAAIKWQSQGAGSYTVEEAERESQGSDIILHLREEMDEFLEEWRIRKIVKQYSDFIGYPIVMDITKTKPGKDEDEDAEPETTVEEETLNSMKAIWKKSKEEVKDEEYKEFYKHLSHDFAEPLEIIHFAAEGVTEFRALLFVPTAAPFDLYFRESRRGLHLYVKNIFITDDCQELLPEYMRFIRGVVDSSDLPLNVSRETLQDDVIIRRIRKGLVGRIIRNLKEMRDKRPDDYLKFWKEFGKVLKEGIHLDFENREKLQELLLFPSTKSEDAKPVSLQEYIERMPEEQQEIFYITGESLDAVRHSPHLELLNKKGYEVLFFVDPIDEWVAGSMTEFNGKALRAIDRGDLELDSEEEKKELETRREEASKEFKHVIECIQESLGDEVKEVRLSSRLTDSACCLVADENTMNANMERLMKAMNQEFVPSKRSLELNPEHPVLKTMKDMLVKDKNDPRLAEYSQLLLDQALLTEGGSVRDPLRFTKWISELMVKANS